MNIIVGPGDLPTVSDEGTVIAVTGTNELTGDRVRFAGDWRAMRGMLDEAHGGEVTAEVESWQVLGVSQS